MELEINKKAPAFNLLDQNNKEHKLSDYSGKWLLLYFYPKDDTPGCTKEACGIRDNFSDFKKIKTSVLGVSADSIEKHQKFAAKYKLPFPLLSDPEKKVLEKYGVWVKKNMMGKTYMGITRTSFLINPKGKIAKIYKTVKPPEHAKQVIDDLKDLI